ncbi:ATP-binding protein [Niabella insulamsoli]|uniref:ATP-binding protein n=1 Tax=Niabella insulamsoli TaxID=3144874 RepID=UPI0031FD9DAE
MNQKGIAFFSIVILALALMALIVVTQYFTNKSTTALTTGNAQAVETFRINIKIQELVNLSFDLEGKLKRITAEADESHIQRLEDSLTVLGYNVGILASDSLIEGQPISKAINNIIDSQVYFSQRILEESLHDSGIGLTQLKDSLRALKAGDRVYDNCQKFQETLKNNLQRTLDTNSEQASKLSFFNRILAIFSILAILVLATIIIRRQSQQMKLIVELKDAELAALKSKNAKDEFLANMSHELRTPLNALIGFGKLLDDTPLNGQQKEYVDIIKSSGYNLLHIVNDVLDLSKIEAGKLTVAHRPFNLFDLVDRIEKMFAPAINEKKLTYSCDLDDRIPEYVIGDPDRLQQILINLISNAIKFTSSGSVTVSTGVVWVDEDDKYFKLSFTVRDTGMGIPKDKIATIFERFEQVEQGARRQHGGTGLGLTIVKNLVERMGGSVSVYSHVNEGSEFNFTCILEKTNTVETKEVSSAADSASFNGFKVLVVEDNRANQVLIKHIFNKHELTPVMTDNGQKAIEILREQAFDLVFMDIQMPVMDGYRAVGLIRNELSLKTPVIAMTAYVSEGEVEKCLAAGFTDYMAKPLDEELLVQKMTLYLYGSEVQQNSVSEADAGEDLSFLKTVVGDNWEMLSEIIKEMNLQWELDRADLLKAAAGKDLHGMHQILHRMKSTFLSLGPQHMVYKLLSENAAELTSDMDRALEKCTTFVEEIDIVIKNTVANAVWK